MSITASVILSDQVQRDGRRLIREQHTDQLGLKYQFIYVADALFDAAAALAARAVQLATDMTNAEIAANLDVVGRLGVQATPTFVYSTGAQNATAVRAAYATMTQTTAAFTGEYLSSLSDVQLQNAFAMTPAQVTSLRSTKLTPAATLAAQIRATTGA